MMRSNTFKSAIVGAAAGYLTYQAGKHIIRAAAGPMMVNNCYAHSDLISILYSGTIGRITGVRATIEVAPVSLCARCRWKRTMRRSVISILKMAPDRSRSCGVVARTTRHAAATNVVHRDTVVEVHWASRLGMHCVFIA
jgi:hypothetical protein